MNWKSAWAGHPAVKPSAARLLWLLLAAALLHDVSAPLTAQPRVLDDFDLAAGGVEEFRIVVPFHDRAAGPGPHLPHAAADAWAAAARDANRRTWESMLDRFSVRLPPDAQPIIDTIKSNLAYIFINQDGPRIQPGSRNYERSWTRAGGIIVKSPLARPIRAVSGDGRLVAPGRDEIKLVGFPAEIVIAYDEPPKTD